MSIFSESFSEEFERAIIQACLYNAVRQATGKPRLKDSEAQALFDCPIPNFPLLDALTVKKALEERFPNAPSSSVAHLRKSLMNEAEDLAWDLIALEEQRYLKSIERRFRVHFFNEEATPVKRKTVAR